MQETMVHKANLVVVQHESGFLPMATKILQILFLSSMAVIIKGVQDAMSLM